jgi:hypothetical protein
MDDGCRKVCSKYRIRIGYTSVREMNFRLIRLEVIQPQNETIDKPATIPLVYVTELMIFTEMVVTIVMVKKNVPGYASAQRQTHP